LQPVDDDGLHLAGRFSAFFMNRKAADLSRSLVTQGSKITPS